MYSNSFIDWMQEDSRRFYDLPPRSMDPPEPEPGWVICACGCGEIIEAGDSCVELDGELYAFPSHLIRALGGREGRLYFDYDGNAYVEKDL